MLTACVMTLAARIHLPVLHNKTISELVAVSCELSLLDLLPSAMFWWRFRGLGEWLGLGSNGE